MTIWAVGSDMSSAHRVCVCGAVLRPDTVLCPACMNTGQQDGKWHVVRKAGVQHDVSAMTQKGGVMEDAKPE